VVTFPSPGSSGLVVVTGTVAGQAGQTESFDLLTGAHVQHGVKFFTAVSGISITGAVGVGTLKIGTSLGYVEYHSPRPASGELSTLEWPIRNTVEVHEDFDLVYGSTTALVLGTTYEVRRRRVLARISNRLSYPFLCGYRVVRARYSAGFKGAAEVPSTIKAVCLELAAWAFVYAQHREYGRTSVSDATGSWAVGGPPMLTSGMRSRLGTYLRDEPFDRTGERDFDLEAA
jgi:hypothetical protein